MTQRGVNEGRKQAKDISISPALAVAVSHTVDGYRGERRKVKFVAS